MSEHELTVALTNTLRAGVLTLRDKWDVGELDHLWTSSSAAVHAFCKTISDQQDPGYRIGSRILCSCLTREFTPLDDRPFRWESIERHHYAADDGLPDPRLLYGVPRELRSLILTACAMWPYTSVRDQREMLRGKHVAHFARVLNRTVQNCARMYVEWFEDMGEGIPDVMPRLPTRVLRGILFATKLAEGTMDSFWSMAARSERFPERIFTDPGDFKHRACLLSPTQFAQLAEFCMQAPEEAVIRFANVYREAVLRMRTITYASAKVGRGVGFDMLEDAFVDLDPELCGSGATPGDQLLELFPDCGVDPRYVCEGDLERTDLPVTDEKRQWLLKRAVLSHIYTEDRQRLVRSIFFPDEKD